MKRSLAASLGKRAEALLARIGEVSWPHRDAEHDMVDSDPQTTVYVTRMSPTRVRSERCITCSSCAKNEEGSDLHI